MEVDTDPDKQQQQQQQQQQQEPQETPTQGRVGLRRRGGEEAAAGGPGATAGRLKGHAAAVRAAQEQVKQLALLFPGLSVAVVNTTGPESVDQAAAAAEQPQGPGAGAAAAAGGGVSDDPGAAATGLTQQQQSLSRVHHQCLPLSQLAQVVVQQLLELAGQQPLPVPLCTALLQLAPLAKVDLLADEQLLLLAEAHLEALLSGRAAAVKVVPDPDSLAGAGTTSTTTPGADPQSPTGMAAGSKKGPGAGAAKQAGRGTAAAGAAGPGSGPGRRTKGAEATAACLAKCEGLLVALQARYLKADMQRQLEQGVLGSMAAATAVQGSDGALSEQQLQQLQKRLLWQAAEARAVPVKAFQAAVAAAAASGQLSSDIVPGAWKVTVLQEQQQQPGCDDNAGNSSSTQPEWGSFSWQPLYTDPSAVEAPMDEETQQGASGGLHQGQAQQQQQQQQHQQQQQEQQQVLLQRVRALWVQALLDDHRGRLQEEGAGLSMLLTQLQQLQQDLQPLRNTQSAAGAAPAAPEGMATGGSSNEQQQEHAPCLGVSTPGAGVSWEGGELLVELWLVPSGSPISLAAVQHKLERMTVRRQLLQAEVALQGAQQAGAASAGRAQLAQEAVQLVQPLCEAAAGESCQAAAGTESSIIVGSNCIWQVVVASSQKIPQY
jgi:hypothetical protein